MIGTQIISNKDTTGWRIKKRALLAVRIHIFKNIFKHFQLTNVLKLII